MKRPHPPITYSILCAVGLIGLAAWYVTARSSVHPHDSGDTVQDLFGGAQDLGGLTPEELRQAYPCNGCVAIATSTRHAYVIQGDAVRYLTTGSFLTRAIDAFRVLSIDGEYAYATDGVDVFMDGHLLYGADPGSFRTFPRSSLYVADGTHVYYRGVPLAAADPASFVMTSSSSDEVAQDAHAVYVAGRVLSQVTDSQTFHLVTMNAQCMNDCIIGYDTEAAYTMHTRIPFVTEERTILLSEPGAVDTSVYVRAGSSVYWFGRADGYDRAVAGGDGTLERTQLAGVDATSLHVLADGYALDNHRVYAHGKLLHGAESTSFRVLGQGYAVDRTHVYSGALELSGVDASTVEVLDRLYLRDRTHVYACIPTFFGRDYGDSRQRSCPIVLAARPDRFRILKRIPDHMGSGYDAGYSVYATDGDHVYLDEALYAAYEHDGRMDLSLPPGARDRVVVHVASAFADALQWLPGGNEVIFAGARWNVEALVKTNWNFADFYPTSSALATYLHTYTDYMVLSLVVGRT